jgi:hypothetical protein
VEGKADEVRSRRASRCGQCLCLCLIRAPFQSLRDDRNSNSQVEKSRYFERETVLSIRDQEEYIREVVQSDD